MSILPIHFPRHLGISRFFLLCVFYCMSLGLGLSGVPQPPCVFYGQARDEYGCPYVSDAEVILRVEGRVCSRWPILGMLTPGVNFKLSLALDDGSTEPYASYAAHPGQKVTISVLTNGRERSIMETRVLEAGQAGDMIGIYVTAGSDVNADGLPDQWQQMLVDGSGGLLSDFNQVLPGDDFDGDGVSNRDEYLSGTYAFLNDDFLRVEEMANLPNRTVRLSFLTTRGFTYQIYAADQTTADWRPVALSLSEASGAPLYNAVVGDGNFLSVYVEMTGAVQFYRLSAQ